MYIKYYEILVTWFLAVSTSILGSVGSLKIIKRLPVKPILKSGLNRIAPFIGVASANLINLFFSKYKDFEYLLYKLYNRNGIKVYDF